jgi:hypothetical protein
VNWREWLYDTLRINPSLTAFIPSSSMYGASALTGSPPSRPFLVIRVNEEASELNEDDRPVVSRREAVIWVYDEPGSYKRIDASLVAIRNILTGQVKAPSAISCRWQGDSTELVDDDLKAVTRNSAYSLYGIAS